MKSSTYSLFITGKDKELGKWREGDKLKKENGRKVKGDKEMNKRRGKEEQQRREKLTSRTLF